VGAQQPDDADLRAAVERCVGAVLDQLDHHRWVRVGVRGRAGAGDDAVLDRISE